MDPNLDQKETCFCFCLFFVFLLAFTVGVAVRSGRVQLSKQPSKKKHHKTPKEPPRTPQDPSRTPQVPSISSHGPLKSRKRNENNPPTQSCVSEPVWGKVYLPPYPPSAGHHSGRKTKIDKKYAQGLPKGSPKSMKNRYKIDQKM